MYSFDLWIISGFSTYTHTGGKLNFRKKFLQVPVGIVVNKFGEFHGHCSHLWVFHRIVNKPYKCGNLFSHR